MKLFFILNLQILSIKLLVAGLRFQTTCPHEYFFYDYEPLINSNLINQTVPIGPLWDLTRHTYETCCSNKSLTPWRLIDEQVLYEKIFNSYDISGSGDKVLKNAVSPGIYGTIERRNPISDVNRVKIVESTGL